MLESTFKKAALNKICARFEDLDLVVVDGKAADRSMPDTYILGPGKWAALEFKRDRDAAQQPNQDYYIRRMSKNGYATFVYPENLEEVIDDLEKLFSA